MNIRLMTYIKNQAIFHGIVYSFNGNGQLHGTKITGQMAAGFGYILNQKRPDLLAELSTFLVIEKEQIIATVDSL